MKDSKKEIRFFSITQWKKEEEYLRAQHKMGWKFVKVNGLCLYHFQKCEPDDVVYQLDYNPDSMTQDQAYLQIFRDCGWEYLQNYAGYSYFRKPASAMDGTEEEIFCDDESRLDMMKRIFKRRVIPLIILFICVIIPQIIMQGQMHASFGDIFILVFGILAGLYLVLLASFGFSFWKYYKMVRKE